MATLPSGLPEIVADEEELVRFLTQSNRFNSIMAKPAAFLPNPKFRNTSVFRIIPDPELIRLAWQQNKVGEGSLKAAAACTAIEVRKTGLDVLPEEPPSRHANLEGWPWLDGDADLQRAKQLEIAQGIAQKSKLVAVTAP
jgi:hypothetical protein